MNLTVNAIEAMSTVAHDRTLITSAQQNEVEQDPAGQRHNQALIALARRRCDVLFAMLRDGTIYQPKSAPTACRNT
jgi:hypothetical protein